MTKAKDYFARGKSLDDIYAKHIRNAYENGISPMYYEDSFAEALDSSTYRRFKITIEELPMPEDKKRWWVYAAEFDLWEESFLAYDGVSYAHDGSCHIYCTKAEREEKRQELAELTKGFGDGS